MEKHQEMLIMDGYLIRKACKVYMRNLFVDFLNYLSYKLNIQDNNHGVD